MESSEIVVWSLVTLVALVVWSLRCVMIMLVGHQGGSYTLLPVSFPYHALTELNHEPLTAHVAAVCIEMPGRKRIVLALWMDTQQAIECQHAIPGFYYNRQHECRQLVVSVKDRSQHYVARAYEL